VDALVLVEAADGMLESKDWPSSYVVMGLLVVVPFGAGDLHTFTIIGWP
jgi:hypothetical protein